MQRDSISQTTILEGVEEVIRAWDLSEYASLLDFDGVSATDILLSPIFFDALNAVRRGTVTPVSRGLKSRIHVWLSSQKERVKQSRIARSSAPVAPTDVLLWPREITHIAAIHQVEQLLRQRGVRCQTLTCQLKSFSDALRNKMSPSLTSIAWPRVINAARAEGCRRARLLGKVSLPTSSTLSAPLARSLEDSVHGSLQNYLVLASVAIANARTALDRYRPKVLLLGNDITLEGRAACRVAAQRGIPTLVFMHGNVTGNVLHSRHCADRFLLHGEIHRQDLIQRGLSPQQLEVIGAPHLDACPKQSGRIHPKLKDGLGLIDGESWILVATSGPGNSISLQHHALILANLRNLITSMPKVRLIFKLHRKDRIEHYQDFLQTCEPGRVRVIAKQDTRFPYDIFDWLQGCSLVLTGASAVAVEAMLMGVPVVTMDFSEEIHGVDFIESGATRHVRTLDQLVTEVRSILEDGPSEELLANSRQYVEGAFYRMDGRSAERGADVICSLGKLT